MSNVHIHLHVADIEASRAFYERLLGAAPVKVKPGYVKFLPDFAPLNLALSAGETGPGKTIDHLGVQVESRELVQVLLDRAKAGGLAVREEMDTTCCHANQDKFWVRDPDGVEWEVYHLNHDVEESEESAASAPPGAATCCTPLARLGKRP